MEGQGEMTWPGGDKYIGDWEDDTRHGFGLYLYHSGNRYKGQYVGGQKVRRNCLHQSQGRARKRSSSSSNCFNELLYVYSC